MRTAAPIALPCLSALMLLAGCVAAPAPAPVVYERPPPPRVVEVVPQPNPYPPLPPPRVERVPPPPRETVFWVAGHWQWEGHGYGWVPGRYVERVVNRRWEPAHWANEGGQWVWVQGRWV